MGQNRCFFHPNPTPSLSIFIPVGSSFPTLLPASTSDPQNSHFQAPDPPTPSQLLYLFNPKSAISNPQIHPPFPCNSSFPPPALNLPFPTPKSIHPFTATLPSTQYLASLSPKSTHPFPYFPPPALNLPFPAPKSIHPFPCFMLPIPNLAFPTPKSTYSFFFGPKSAISNCKIHPSFPF